MAYVEQRISPEELPRAVSEILEKEYTPNSAGITVRGHALSETLAKLKEPIFRPEILFRGPRKGGSLLALLSMFATDVQRPIFLPKTPILVVLHAATLCETTRIKEKFFEIILHSRLATSSLPLPEMHFCEIVTVSGHKCIPSRYSGMQILYYAETSVPKRTFPAQFLDGRIPRESIDEMLGVSRGTVFATRVVQHNTQHVAQREAYPVVSATDLTFSPESPLPASSPVATNTTPHAAGSMSTPHVTIEEACRRLAHARAEAAAFEAKVALASSSGEVLAAEDLVRHHTSFVICSCWSDENVERTHQETIMPLRFHCAG